MRTFFQQRVVISIILFTVIALAFVLSIILRKEVEAPIPIVLLKLPRSGSSWLTEKLNAYPEIFLSKEIIQRKDLQIISKEIMETKLVAALQEPTDKAKSFSKFIFSTRFWRDYIFPLKFSNSLKYVGFTLNPEHAIGLYSYNLFFNP